MATLATPPSTSAAFYLIAADDCASVYDQFGYHASAIKGLRPVFEGTHYDTRNWDGRLEGISLGRGYDNHHRNRFYLTKDDEVTLQHNSGTDEAPDWETSRGDFRVRNLKVDGSLSYGYVGADKIAAEAFYVKGSDGQLYSDGTNSRLVVDQAHFEDFIDLEETSTPATPDSTHVRIWAQDNNGHTVINWKDDDGNTFQLGRDQVLIARNVTGSTIAAGKLVYVSGSTGQRPQISLADYGSTTTMPAIGITVAAITNNSFGLVQIHGLYTGVDVSSFSDGDEIWVASSGGLTNTKPTSPNEDQSVGFVINAAANGTILISANGEDQHVEKIFSGGTTINHPDTIEFSRHDFNIERSSSDDVVVDLAEVIEAEAFYLQNGDEWSTGKFSTAGSLSVNMGGSIAGALAVGDKVTGAGFYLNSGVNFGHDLGSIDLPFDIPSVDVENYWIDSFASQGYVIREAVIITQSGSCTAAFYIHGDGETTPGVSVTGLDPISVTTTKSTLTPTGANVVNQGDSLVLSVPANSSGTHLRGRLRVDLAG